MQLIEQLQNNIKNAESSQQQNQISQSTPTENSNYRITISSPSNITNTGTNFTHNLDDSMDLHHQQSSNSRSITALSVHEHYLFVFIQQLQISQEFQQIEQVFDFYRYLQLFTDEQRSQLSAQSNWHCISSLFYRHCALIFAVMYELYCLSDCNMLALNLSFFISNKSQTILLLECISLYQSRIKIFANHRLITEKQHYHQLAQLNSTMTQLVFWIQRDSNKTIQMPYRMDQPSTVQIDFTRYNQNIYWEQAEVCMANCLIHACDKSPRQYQPLRNEWLKIPQSDTAFDALMLELGLSWHYDKLNDTQSNQMQLVNRIFKHKKSQDFTLLFGWLAIITAASFGLSCSNKNKYHFSNWLLFTMQACKNNAVQSAVVCFKPWIK